MVEATKYESRIFVLRFFFCLRMPYMAKSVATRSKRFSAKNGGMWLFPLRREELLISIHVVD